MGNAYKREVKDWRGVVIGCDVGRFFPIEAHAAADHAEAELNNITIAAFVPALSAGPAFDSMEAIGSAQRIPGGYHVTLPPLERGEVSQLIAPPNCEGFAHAGEALAHAQHEAATDGDDCTSGACLITRGSD